MSTYVALHSTLIWIREEGRSGARTMKSDSAPVAAEKSLCFLLVDVYHEKGTKRGSGFTAAGVRREGL